MDVLAHEMKSALDLIRRQRAVKDAIAAGTPTEVCGQCRGKTVCPWMCIVAAKPGKGTRGITGEWNATPICEECHRTPNGTLKGHYCERADAPAFLKRAGSTGVVEA